MSPAGLLLSLRRDHGVAVVEVRHCCPSMRTYREESRAHQILQRAASIGRLLGVGVSMPSRGAREASSGILDQAQSARARSSCSRARKRRTTHGAIFGSTVETRA